jgi:alkanesulfonate monooxygenase
VFPKLPLRSTTGSKPNRAYNAGPFGEVTANEIVPLRRAAG